MASISTEASGHGRSKAVDAEIPLIPFIDLLLCCVMFLLVTAVWNELASLDARLDAPGTPESEMVVAAPLDLPLTVRIEHDGYVLSTGLGDETHIPRLGGGNWDTVALQEHLERRRRIDPSELDVMITADDGIEYAQIVRAMDVLSGTGYSGVTVAGSL